jgi:hypothetical protein
LWSWSLSELSPLAPRNREQFRAAMAAIIAPCSAQTRRNPRSRRELCTALPDAFLLERVSHGAVPDPRLDPPATEGSKIAHEGRVVGDRTILLGLLAGIILAMSLYIRETGATWPSPGTAP